MFFKSISVNTLWAKFRSLVVNQINWLLVINTVQNRDICIFAPTHYICMINLYQLFHYHGFVLDVYQCAGRDVLLHLCGFNIGIIERLFNVYPQAKSRSLAVNQFNWIVDTCLNQGYPYFCMNTLFMCDQVIPVIALSGATGISLCANGINVLGGMSYSTCAVTT